MGSISVRDSPSSNDNDGTLPYWQVNVPVSQRTEECPGGLRNLDAKDVAIISTPNADYKRQTWPEVKHLIATNRLDLFMRVPSELRRYRLFMHELTGRYGSVMEFVLSERLGWSKLLLPRGRPFEYEEDWKVLHNDWPYGIDELIVHLVVWTKFELEEDVTTGDLSEGARLDVERFVGRTFKSQVKEDTVSRGS